MIGGFTLFIIASLANYRLSRLIAVEDGPFDLFSRLRARLGGAEQKTWVGRGINCPLCIGFWLAIPISILAFGEFNVLGWLAVAGFQTLMSEVER